MIPTELSKLSLEETFKGHFLPLSLNSPVDTWKSKSRSILPWSSRGEPPLCHPLCFTQVYVVWINYLHQQWGNHGHNMCTLQYSYLEEIRRESRTRCYYHSTWWNKQGFLHQASPWKQTGKILIFLFLLLCIWMKQLLKSTSILQFSPTLGLFTASVWIVYRTQCHAFFLKKVKSLNTVRLFVTPWTVAYQASLSMGFSRQEYWSG